MSQGAEMRNTIINGDVIKTLATFPDECVDCVVTSPPYWGLRDYGVPGQIGLEPTLDEFIARLTQVFHEVKRVLKPDGTLWLNMGDSYISTSGNMYPQSETYKHGHNKYKEWERKQNRGLLKTKDLIGQPWRLAFALQADGWYLRSDIIWSKPNPMPESVTDRPTKAHEYVFLMTKSPRYYYDAEAIREPLQTDPELLRKRVLASQKAKIHEKTDAMVAKIDRFGATTKAYAPTGRNKRTVWEIATQPMPSAHFATFPEKLVEPCVLAGTSEKGYCSECGKAWVRVVKASPIHGSAGVDYKDKGSGRGKRSFKGGADHAAWKKQYPNTTIGWRPTCGCYDDLYRTEYAKAKSKRKAWQQDASGNWWRRVKKRPGLDHWDTVPGVVLDPFMGSGTVALVAHRLDRDFVGIELSPEYYEIAQKRIGEEVAQGRLFAGG